MESERAAREEMLVESVTISRREFDAAIFDLDGVLTETARLHAAAWKAVFDTFLLGLAQRCGLAFQPFDIEADYLDYVDGRPREDGIRDRSPSRGLGDVYKRQRRAIRAAADRHNAVR